MVRLKILNLLFFSFFTVFLVVLLLVHFYSFCIYTSLLSIVISQCGAHRHLYADYIFGSSFLLLPQNISETMLFLKILLLKSVLGCLPIYTCLILLTLTFCSLVFLYKKISNLKNPTVNVTSDFTLSPVPQARNLYVLFHYNSSLSGHIFSITKPCFSHIRDLRLIRPILDQITAPNIASALVHS
jgi:hypothetical protein